MLPSCGCCNGRKQAFCPPGLSRDSLCDPALPAEEDTRAYTPQAVLPERSHRLVEPSFDEPAAHLHFEALLGVYRALTPTGQLTIARLFNERDHAMELNELRDHVRYFIGKAASMAEFEEDIRRLIDLAGRSFYIRAFAREWQELERPGWADREREHPGAADA